MATSRIGNALLGVRVFFAIGVGLSVVVALILMIIDPALDPAKGSAVTAGAMGAALLSSVIFGFWYGYRQKVGYCGRCATHVVARKALIGYKCEHCGSHV